MDTMDTLLSFQVTSGVAVDLLLIIARRLNFEVSWVLAPSWGHFEPDGSYRGTPQKVYQVVYTYTVNIMSYTYV